jgi:hypothetical protein
MSVHRLSAGDQVLDVERHKRSTGHRTGLQFAGPDGTLAHYTPQQIQRLQGLAGNAAVSRLVAENRAPKTPTMHWGDYDSENITAGVSNESVTVSDVTEIGVEAVIPRRPPGQGEAAAGRIYQTNRASQGDLDAEEGGAVEEVDPSIVEEAFAASIVPVADPEPGETVSLPDMSVPVSSAGADRDAVAGFIAYSSSVTQAGAVEPFGSTTWHNFSVVGATVTPTPTAPRVFVARFTLTNPITFNVTSPKQSIASADDPAITNGNYPNVISDLTPDMGVWGGKPPRRHYWARDLTVIHEQFHCAERQRFATAGTTQAQAWLSAQTAGSVADVQALIARVPARVVASSLAAAGTVDEKETRAYGAGAGAYQARADAIRAKGALGSAGGGYP